MPSSKLRPVVGDLLVEVEAVEQFAERWEQPAIAAHGSERKTIRNPVVGDLTLDCDVLTVHGSDLRVVVFTATPGTGDMEKLALLNVTTPQDMPVTGLE